MNNSPDFSEDLYEHHRLTVDKGQSPFRLDVFLTNRLENVSRNKIQNAARAGNILVNDKPAKPNYKIRPADVISILLPGAPRDTENYPEDIPLTIVHEDEDVLVVNKPAGMVVHPAYANYTGTLVNALLFHFAGQTGKDGNPVKPWLVHRIDKDTSGLVLIARNEFAQALLARQFFEHSIRRHYHALVWGDLAADSGTISGFINRSQKDRRVMTLYSDPEKGRHSITHYSVLERFGYVTLVECRLETGRTHQIRAHFSHTGHPLFGDTAYGGRDILKGSLFAKYRQFVENSFELLAGQALHAKTLGFVHPSAKTEVFFDSALPEAFASVVERWRRYTSGREF